MDVCTCRQLVRWDRCSQNLLHPLDVNVSEGWVSRNTLAHLKISDDYSSDESRPLRYLLYALEADWETTLNWRLAWPPLKHFDVFEHLQKIWKAPEPGGRNLIWPLEVERPPGEFRIGDVGVFDHSDARSKGVFRKLCDLSKELGSSIVSSAYFGASRFWDVCIPGGDIERPPMGGTIRSAALGFRTTSSY